MALGADSSFVARTVDVEAKHLQDVVRRAHEHRGTSFVEILQNCNIFNDGAFGDADREGDQGRAQLVLEHGKPLIFGKNRDKGIRLRGHALEVVQLGNGVSEADLVVHDETDPALASCSALMTPPKFPTPIGVFRAVTRQTYEIDRCTADRQCQAAARRRGSRRALEPRRHLDGELTVSPLNILDRSGRHANNELRRQASVAGDVADPDSDQCIAYREFQRGIDAPAELNRARAFDLRRQHRSRSINEME